MVELIDNLFKKNSANIFIPILLIILFFLWGCGRKGDLDRPASLDGLNPPEMVEDRAYKY